ncbi:hypothetical protein EVA_17195 [gut metagenome]|uniref:Uncharacterized protein n=1 Tax=gut metagenome TaxID=749906 RepID=J9G5B2_9ZZZZ
MATISFLCTSKPQHFEAGYSNSTVCCLSAIIIRLKGCGRKDNSIPDINASKYNTFHPL